MAKSSSSELVSEVETLLKNLAIEASAGDKEIKNDETGEVKVIPGPTFSERLKLVSTMTGFLQAKAKLVPEDDKQPSAFEGILNELNGAKNRGKARRAKKAKDGNQSIRGEIPDDDGGETPDIGIDINGTRVVIDYLADSPADKYIIVNGHGSDHGGTGEDGSAPQ